MELFSHLKKGGERKMRLWKRLVVMIVLVLIMGCGVSLTAEEKRELKQFEQSLEIPLRKENMVYGTKGEARIKLANAYKVRIRELGRWLEQKRMREELIRSVKENAEIRGRGVDEQTIEDQKERIRDAERRIMLAEKKKDIVVRMARKWGISESELKKELLKILRLRLRK
jgi:hypothetical protein